MHKGIVDLHCHTHHSDNPSTVREVIALAKEQGVSHLAITDHDTTDGLHEAARLGRELGVDIVPGIEISAYDTERKRRAHILGYNVEPGHPSLEALCGPLRARRHEISQLIVQRLQQHGFDIAWEDVLRYARAGSTVFKQHIMHALVDKGYCTRVNGELQKRLFARGGGGTEPGIAFISMEYADARKAIAAIREAGGVAVLAHPGQLGNFEAIDEWVKAGLQGIEAAHPSHSAEDEALARLYAAKHGLVITAGSDYHGAYGNEAHLPGCMDAGLNAVLLLKEMSSGSRSVCP
ncbi:PHP domain-containing protein [Paenibacillus hamazuiensis]|uniref:PHP domain-containing protein n=1 Tax=Paenibacillus hamazuiensis TaxID=2936508 RepID=UPI00200E14F4|nr:PHP domain-containing protein [Paenibacillus hamazuiensis]